MTNTIPPITDPMGKHWKQPDPSEIAIDDKHALMTESTFEKLLDYSHSEPTGVYVGKMWKRRLLEGWALRWFAEDERSDYVRNELRVILIA